MMQRATVPSPRHRRRQVNHDDIFFFLTSTRVQIQDMCMSNALAVWRSLQRITYVVDKKKKTQNTDACTEARSSSAK